jgi:hypothetical protein
MSGANWETTTMEDIESYRKWRDHLLRIDNTRLSNVADYCDMTSENRNSEVTVDVHC